MAKLSILQFPNALKIVESLKIKRKEKVLILSDDAQDKRLTDIIQQACAEKTNFAQKDESLPIIPQEEFPKRLFNRLYAADCIILVTTHSWYHTPLRRRLKYEFKKRIVDCYGLNLKMLKKGGLSARSSDLRKINSVLVKVAQDENSLRIYSKQGTEVVAFFQDLVCEYGDYYLPGSGGNLPAGEVAFCLQPGSVKGRVVFDLSFDFIGRVEKYFLEIKIADGRIKGVKGKFSSCLEEILEKDPRVGWVAEIAMGTNPLTIFGHSILEDEKRLGAIHFGFGNDVSFGGKNQGLHLDGVLRKATLKVGNKFFLKDGKLNQDLFSHRLFKL